MKVEVWSTSLLRKECSLISSSKGKQLIIRNVLAPLRKMSLKSAFGLHDVSNCAGRLSWSHIALQNRELG